VFSFNDAPEPFERLLGRVLRRDVGVVPYGCDLEQLGHLVASHLIHKKSHSPNVRQSPWPELGGVGRCRVRIVSQAQLHGKAQLLKDRLDVQAEPSSRRQGAKLVLAR